MDLQLSPEAVSLLPRVHSKVAILVESGRHRDEILAEAEGWTRYAPGSVAEFVLSRQIVTHRELERASLDEIDILVRADGTPGVPVPLDATLINSSRSNPLVLVDLRDDFQSELKAWAKSRDASYRSRLWPDLRDPDIGSLAAGLIASPPVSDGASQVGTTTRDQSNMTDEESADE